MRWIVRRVGQAIITFVSVITISFGIVRFLPGGPLDYVRAKILARSGGGQGVSSGAMDRVNTLVEVYTNIRPDQPIYVQYIDYILNVLQGDLGKSLLFSRDVTTILADALPWTIFLMSISLLLTFTIGITLGALLAYNEGSRFDMATSSLIVWLNGIPYYVAALVMLFVFAYSMGLFPISGRVNGSVPPGSPQFFMSALYHAALPIISVVITEFGGWALAMRGNSIQTLGEDYLRVARLRGVPSNRIAMRYVGRNAILPMYTNLMIAIGFLFGGSVILEQVFAYPGVGFFMVRAINARDYPLVMGCFLVITLAVVIGVMIADMTYGLIDPRIRASSGGEA
jgi:peptide/nickel transport system permease protein